MTTETGVSRSAWTAVAVLTMFAGAALGQLTPDRLYYPQGQPVPMTVRAPGSGGGALTVQLLAAGSGEMKASASVVAGKVDLAALFPTLWKPEGGTPALLYAQLVAGDAKVGPAVVVQPLASFQYARWDPSEQSQFKFGDISPNKTYSGVRAYVDKYIVMDTTEGAITLALRPDKAPNTCYNMVHLAEGGFYSNIPFHRIVPTAGEHPFVIQGGDPAGNGEGGPGYFIDLEPSDLPHDFGVISMARFPDANSAGSQFFICLSREGTLPLDGLYTSFGYTIDGKGGDAILKIAATPLDPATNRPVNAPVVKSVKAVDAEPYNGAPPPAKRPAAPAPDR